MKAAVLYEFKQPLQWVDVDDPVPAPDQVLVQVMACGTDGTDLKILQGFGYTPTLPAVIGHEVAGIVAQIGKTVAGWKPGDRVVIYNFISCGECLLCRIGREQICADLKGIIGAKGLQGGFAEIIAVPARQLIQIPEGLSMADAAVCCDAGMTAIHAVDRSGLKAGDKALVIGAGGVGSFVIQLARGIGTRVISVEVSAEKAQWARRNGADYVFDPGKADIPIAVRELTEGIGVDLVLDVVGSQDTMSIGFRSLRPGGRMVVIGYTPDHFPVEGKFLAQNELEIIGTRAGTKQDLRNVVQLFASGKLTSVVTDQFPMEKANEALAALAERKVMGRAVLLTPAGLQEQA